MAGIKLGSSVRGTGEVVSSVGRGESKAYCVRFPMPDGQWQVRLMTEQEIRWRPGKPAKGKARRKRKPPPISTAPATVEERRAMEALSLTLRQLREARA